MTTNNDPYVILLPYLTVILRNNGTQVRYLNGLIFFPIGCPSIIRSDYGTENSILAACHMALCHNHNDKYSGDRSFQFGSSTTNTVESI